MDILTALFVIALALVSLAGLGATFGVDSRDGFADDRLRTSLR